MRTTESIYSLLASLRIFGESVPIVSQAESALENLLSETSTLSLVDNGLVLTSGARAVLAQAQSFETLCNLDLSHNALGDAGIAALFEGLAGRRAQLRIIRLASCSMTDVGLLAIIKHCLLPGPPRLPSLRQLFLNQNRIELGPTAAALLASALSHRSSQLRRLNLTSNAIKGLRLFLRNLQTRNLRSLQLNACGLEPEDGLALFDWLLEPANPLIRLELNANQLTEEVMTLFTSRLFDTGLQQLELLANSDPAPSWEPVRFGPYEMAAQDATRFFSHQLRREALGMLATARIISQARPAPKVPDEQCFPLMRLPVELRQRIVLCTQTTDRTPFHQAARGRPRLGIFLSQMQFARIWSYASDRGTLAKSSRPGVKFKTDDERREAIEDEKESYLVEVKCLKLDK